jgi:hypothetical protein
VGISGKRFPLTPRPYPLQASLNAHLRGQTLRLRKGEDIIASPMMTGLPCTAVWPSAAPTEDEKCSGERVLIESVFAECGERVDAFAKIDGLVSEQDIELGDKLNHRRQERRKSAQSRWMETRSRDGSVSVRREPSGRSIWSRQLVGLCGNGDPTSGNAISVGS